MSKRIGKLYVERETKKDKKIYLKNCIKQRERESEIKLIIIGFKFKLR